MLSFLKLPPSLILGHACGMLIFLAPSYGSWSYLYHYDQYLTEATTKIQQGKSLKIYDIRACRFPSRILENKRRKWQISTSKDAGFKKLIEEDLKEEIGHRGLRIFRLEVQDKDAKAFFKKNPKAITTKDISKFYKEITHLSDITFKENPIIKEETTKLKFGQLPPPFVNYLFLLAPEGGLKGLFETPVGALKSAFGTPVRGLKSAFGTPVGIVVKGKWGWIVGGTLLIIVSFVGGVRIRRYQRVQKKKKEEAQKARVKREKRAKRQKLVKRYMGWMKAR